MSQTVSIMDKIRLYSDILRYKREKRLYDVVSHEYDLGVWNKKYEEIDFEKWLGNYGVDGNKIRILVQDGKLFKGKWSEFIDKYMFQIFDVLENYKTESVVELGCGLGHNIFQLRKRGFNNLAGYDISKNAILSLKRFCTEKNVDIKFDVQDLAQPFPDGIIENKVVFTHTCLEQLKRFMPSVLTNIINGNPKLVINFEVDYDSAPFLVKQYFRARDYQNNLVSELRKLERKNQIEILSINKLRFYLSPTNRPSCIIWKIKKS